MTKVLKRIMNSSEKNGTDKIMKKFITNIHQHINLVPLGVNLLVVMLITLFFACGVSKTTTHNCELMEKGQKCLVDHSCCK